MVRAGICVVVALLYAVSNVNLGRDVFSSAPVDESLRIAPPAGATSCCCKHPGPCSKTCCPMSHGSADENVASDVEEEAPLIKHCAHEGAEPPFPVKLASHLFFHEGYSVFHKQSPYPNFRETHIPEYVSQPPDKVPRC